LDQTTSQNNLKEIVLMYITYHDKHNKPPAKVEDLKEFAGDYARGYQGIQEGRYEVVWNADMSKQPGGPDSVLLAWEKEPDASGNRNAITARGTAKNLSAKDFQAAKKAVGK
jgi:hypothetical protein